MILYYSAIVSDRLHVTVTYFKRITPGINGEPNFKLSCQIQQDSSINMLLDTSEVHNISYS